MTKAKVFNADGSSASQVELPTQFDEFYRPDVIKRAFWSFESLSFQPKGSFPLAGMQNTAEYYGRRHAWRQTINTGRSRLPRERVAGGRSGRVLPVPHAIKGRRAHPPKAEKKLIEKINKKEKNLALRSAIAATGNAKLVSKRGHLFSGEAPIVVSDSFENIKKSKEAFVALQKIGFKIDMEKSEKTRAMVSGVHANRKGGYKERRSVLVVCAKAENCKAYRNIPGVESSSVDKLNMNLLAPGGVAGRLCVWTEGALKRMRDEKLFE